MKTELIYCENKLYKTNKKETILEKKQDVWYLSFPALSNIPFIKHGFSTRIGGVSEGDLYSMNLSFNRGDDIKNVYENYQRICAALEVSTEDLVFTDQVHDTKIQVVSKEHRAGKKLESKKLVGVDGLITNVPKLVLTTSYADCVPLFFVDCKKKAIGLSHSGWRGTVGKIGVKTIEAMAREYGSDAKDIIVVIGPSICKSCYEVSVDVVEQFSKILSEQAYEAVIEEKANGKYLLDLWNTNRFLLKEAGILEENIHISDICTCCNHDILYSHRFTNGKRGNLSAFLSLI